MPVLQVIAGVNIDAAAQPVRVRLLCSANHVILAVLARWVRAGDDEPSAMSVDRIAFVVVPNRTRGDCGTLW